MTFIQLTESKCMLTVNDVAKLLSISVSTVYRMLENKELKSKRISARKIVIPADEIIRYISEH